MSNSTRLILILVTAVLAWAGAATARGLDDIKEKGELSVAVYRDFAPFSSRRDGKLVGVDIDLAQAIAKRLKLRLSVMELTAGDSVDDDLRNGVWKGHYLDHQTADVMLHIPTDRVFALRNTNVVILAPYFRERVVVARNPEKVLAKDDITIFEQEKVGVELATLADIYLTAQLGPKFVVNVVHFPNLTAATQALAKGDVAAVMGTETELAAALGKNAPRFPVAPMDSPGLTKAGWELGLAVRDSNRELGHVLDDVMAGLKADGTIAAIFRRHHLPYHPPEE